MNSCMRGIIGFLFLINISITWLHARNLELRFEKISIDQGLSHSSVTAIHLDKQGFLWFGTQDGLNRYDGYNFKIFRNSSADSN
ncbi:MAG: two-component regulator propeller domain-containing protein, partial [Calditrichaceae bacterium]